MAKKNKDEAPNPNSITNRDILQRLNFLYQASTLLNNIATPSPSAGPSTVPGPQDVASSETTVHDAVSSSDVTKGDTKMNKRQRQREKSKRRHPTTCADLSKTYIRTMKNIGQKTTVRMDPSVKRTLCKNCNIVLLPGSSALVRVKTSSTHGHAVIYTCTSCKTSRRIPAPPTLELDDAELASNHQMQSSQAASQSTTSPEGNAMEVDTHVLEKGKGPSPLDKRRGRQRRGRQRKKPPVARLPPFFERKVGHVIFRGNERLED